MKELKETIKKAFEANQANFIIELHKIFRENEYRINHATVITVSGYFDDAEYCPYLRFHIKTDNDILSTAFYKYNYSAIENSTKEELDVLDSNENVVTALQLFQDDLREN